jgi:hypothetical protein
MNILQIRKMAKNLEIKTYRKKKADIIREIQIKEGNFPCFGTAKDWCDQINCLWRSDCLK